MNDAIILTIEGVRTRASTNEALVTFAVPLEQAALVSGFMSKIGQQVGAAFADIEQAASKARAYGTQAKALKLSGFCRSPEVWKLLGTDEQFREWVQKQPSCWSGEFSEYINGDGRCEAAHVSRIEYGRGIGHKPEYACIPLTHKEHMLHHAKGESALGGRDWFEKMRIKYIETWAWAMLKEAIGGYESMADIPPGVVLNWAKTFNVEHLLPAGYRDAA
jgi:hypothetical protein